MKQWFPAGMILAGLLAAATPQPARYATLPAVSPDGKRIAFLSERNGISELCISDAGGDHVTRLTRSERAPQWAPDGRRLFYANPDGDNLTLWSIDRAGGTPSLLAQVPARSGRISTRGDRIAYTVGSWTRNRIVIASLAGDHPVPVTDSTVGYFNMAWSPDDQQLAVTRRDTTGELQVWLVNVDGTGTRALTHFGAAEGRPEMPAWSPDQKRIALQATRRDTAEGSNSIAHIWIVEIATGQATRLAPHDAPYLDETPCWFPDGKRIAFQSTRSGRFEVWAMKADGTGLRLITR